MANQDYINREDQENLNYSHVPEKEPTLGGIVSDIAKVTIGIGILKMAGKGLAGKVFKSFISSNEAAAKAIAGGDISAFQKNISLGSLVRGIGKTASENPNVFKVTSDSGKKWLEAIGGVSKASLQVGKSASTMGSRLLNSKSIAAKSAYKLGSYLARGLPASTAFYAVERTIGSNRTDTPAWYNVPGNIAHYGKSMVEYAAFDGVLKAGLGGIKLGLRGIKGAAASTLNINRFPGLHRVADKYLARTISGESTKSGAFLQSVLKFSAMTHAAREGYKNFSTGVGELVFKNWGNKAATAMKASPRNKLSMDFIKRTYDNAKAAAVSTYKSRLQGNIGTNNVRDVSHALTSTIAKSLGISPERLRSSPMSMGRLSEFDAAKKPIVGTYKIFREDGNNGFLSGLLDQIKTLNDKSGSSVGPILKRRMATAEDVLSKKDRVYHKALFRAVREMSHGHGVDAIVSNLEKSFFSMRVGKGVYKGTSGAIDYSMYSPRNLLKSAVNFVEPFTTFNLPGAQVNLMSVLGLKQFMAKEGLASYSFGVEENHFYREMIDGHRSSYKSTFGSKMNAQHFLGGAHIGDSLYVTDGGMGALKKVEGWRSRLLPNTPFSQYSVLNKISADSASQKQFVYKHFLEINQMKEQRASGGIKEKIMQFPSRMGLGMPPLFKSIWNRTQDALGIGPRANKFKEMIEFITGSADNLTDMDATALFNNVLSMGDSASKDLYPALTNPKMLRQMATMAGRTKNAKMGGAKINQILDIVSGNSTDRDLIKLVEQSDIDDSSVRSIIAGYKEGTLNLNEGSYRGKRFGSRKLSHKDELLRKLTIQEMGNTFAMGPGEGMHFNLADELLKSKHISDFSQVEKDDLQMLAAKIDLWNVGQAGRNGPGGMFGDNMVKQRAKKTLRKRFKNQEQLLLRQLHDTPGGGMGDFLNNNLWKDDYFHEQVEKSFAKFTGIPRSQTISSPYVIQEKGSSMLLDHINHAMDRTMDLLNVVGVKYGHVDRLDTTISLPKWLPIIGGERKIMAPMKAAGRRIGQAIGVMAAYQALDTFADLNPLFSNTILSGGITNAAVDVYMKSSLAFHKLKDWSGITDASKYMEGLMPMSTSSIPGGVIGGFMFGPLGIPAGMIANRMLQPMLPDMDKSYEEMTDIYSGRELIPVRKGRLWPFSKSDLLGDGPSYFRPHWAPKLKSQYKYTETLYGSRAEAAIFKPWPMVGANPIGHFIDKYHYEKKHYYTRPYPETAPYFQDVPLVGSLLASTIGRIPIIGKPVVNMHQDEMDKYYNTGKPDSAGAYSQSNIPKPTPLEGLEYMNLRGNAMLSAEHALLGSPTETLNRYGGGITLGQQIYNFTEFSGFKGFLAETMMGGIPFDKSRRYSTTNEMWSTSRFFYDAQLGDLMGLGEGIRRFIPREKKIWDKVNPLKNKMAGWLPGGAENDYHLDLLSGDPFTKLPDGEIRLPGQAYSSLYNVKHSFPGRPSSLGKEVADNVKFMVGLADVNDMDEDEILTSGTEIHRQIQENLLRSNMAVKAEALVYDREHDIAGFIDVVLRDPYQRGGVRAMEIKTMSGEKFKKLSKPVSWHMSQLNFYLKQVGNDVGTLLYINRDDPTQTRSFDIRYSEDRLNRDFINLEKARQISAGIMADGKGFEDGSSYSWLDRLRILSDVAPGSKQYQTAKKIVSLQAKAGKLSEEEIAEVNKINWRRKAVQRKYELYPYRFAGRVFNPDIDYEQLNMNENIKAAANYNIIERTIGGAYERVMHLNTPLHTKLFNMRSPLEHYQRTKFYGSQDAFWNKPYQDIIAPMFRQSFASKGPGQGAASLGWLGYVGLGGFGGGAGGALIGSAVGALYGAANEVIGPDAWVPEEVQKRREVESYFDQLKYIRARNLYDMTGDQKYITEAEETMTAVRNRGYVAGMRSVMRSLSNFDKPYFNAFIREGSKAEREQILKYVPLDVSKLLRRQWDLRDTGVAGKILSKGHSDIYADYVPNIEWSGFGPREELSDIQVKTMEEESLDAHDSGLGWYDQQRRMSESPYDLSPLDMNDSSQILQSSKNFNSGALRQALQQYLSNIAFRPLVYIGFTPGGSDKADIQLNVTRDRREEMRELLKGY